MKLNIVPARTGIEWVKLGIQTFFKQPLALAGLFFLFMAIMSIATLIPLHWRRARAGVRAGRHAGPDGRHAGGHQGQVPDAVRS